MDTLEFKIGNIEEDIKEIIEQRNEIDDIEEKIEDEKEKEREEKWNLTFEYKEKLRDMKDNLEEIVQNLYVFMPFLTEQIDYVNRKKLFLEGEFKNPHFQYPLSNYVNRRKLFLEGEFKNPHFQYPLFLVASREKNIYQISCVAERVMHRQQIINPDYPRTWLGDMELNITIPRKYKDKINSKIEVIRIMEESVCNLKTRSVENVLSANFNNFPKEYITQLAKGGDEEILYKIPFLLCSIPELTKRALEKVKIEIEKRYSDERDKISDERDKIISNLEAVEDINKIDPKKYFDI